MIIDNFLSSCIRITIIRDIFPQYYPAQKVCKIKRNFDFTHFLPSFNFHCVYLIIAKFWFIATRTQVYLIKCDTEATNSVVVVYSVAVTKRRRRTCTIAAATATPTDARSASNRHGHPDRTDLCVY